MSRFGYLLALWIWVPAVAVAQTAPVSIGSRVSALMQAGGAGGTQGLYLKQINGSVLARQQETFVFDPAGTVSLLEHFYAMVQVARGAANLDQSVFHYGNPPASCPDPAIFGPNEPLSTALREMMWHGDYARARSVYDFFGRNNINGLARDSGLANTVMNQIPGCIQAPPNRTTLGETSRIFELVAAGSLPSGQIISTTHDAFLNLMAGKAQFLAEGTDAAHIWDTDLPSIIRQEAPSGTTAAQQTAYRDSMGLSYKTGDYAVCQSDCTQIQEYISLAGWAKVPYCASNGTVYNEFVFGLFFAGAPDNAWFAGKTTVAGASFAAVKSELLREQIHAGLASCYGNRLAIISPPPGTTFSSRIVGFTWSPAPNADGYELDAGSSIGGSDYGTVQSPIQSAALANLPCDGRTIYVRLSMHAGSAFVNPVDYTYTACTNTYAAIGSPVPGSNLGASSVTFRWNAVNGADSYRLDAGSFQGAQDIGTLTLSATAATINNIPTDGRTIYVRLTTHTSAGFQAPNDFIYTNILGGGPGNDLAIGNVVNAASLQPALSPTCVAVVNGSNFGSDATVSVGNIKAVLIGAPSPDRITFLVPPTSALGSQNVTVTSKGITTQPFPIQLTQASPGLYPQSAGSMTGRFLDAGGTPISSGHPANGGDVLSAFAAGVGPLDSTGKATLALRVLVGDARASATILSAGPASGQTGVTEIKFRVPAGTPSGNQPVLITAGSFGSNIVQLPIAGPAASALLNAGSFAAGAAIAPGSIVSLFGTSLASDDQFGVFPSPVLPGGGAISFNGIPAPLFDVISSQGQINLLVPMELAPGAATVTISNAYGVSSALPVSIAVAAPGIFRIPDPSKPTRANAAALLANTAWRVIPLSMAAALGIPQDCSGNGIPAAAICGQPAAPGDVISVFVTGLGRATPNGNPAGQALRTGQAAPADGSVIYRTVQLPQVTIGGADATVLFSGIAPGYAGLYQVNVAVPAGAPAGDDVPMTIAMPDSITDTATIAIRKP